MEPEVDYGSIIISVGAFILIFVVAGMLHELYTWIF
jgi:hypothetical protein